ncbi:putative capsid protein [Soft spider associated circular virus 1]|uniref:Putative capsid protein n=1 Tax=Soft spider associated circular virus 1 TaxID=2293301 RepID=A0A346BP97_9CIRC|nr:putative capsid protein [Soft spider associated circular virus 1]AXL65894.1 putative capsid protein [Soft spider associated circular virus 1]
MTTWPASASTADAAPPDGSAPSAEPGEAEGDQTDAKLTFTASVWLPELQSSHLLVQSSATDICLRVDDLPFNNTQIGYLYSHLRINKCVVKIYPCGNFAEQPVAGSYIEPEVYSSITYDPQVVDATYTLTNGPTVKSHGPRSKITRVVYPKVCYPVWGVNGDISSTSSSIRNMKKAPWMSINSAGITDACLGKLRIYMGANSGDGITKVWKWNVTKTYYFQLKNV